MTPDADWLNRITWNADGLVAAIAQEAGSGDVLMLAWMNREALQETLRTRRAVYWSRSRQKLWLKGETSGHIQQVQDIRLDCDGDALLLTVVQTGHAPGIACHTGRHSCFYAQLQSAPAGPIWVDVEPVIKAP